MEKKPANWFPSTQQLSSPDELERSFRETLRQLYSMQDKVDELHKKVNAPAPKQTGNPNTASASKILGLPVEPSDTSQLADGTVLTYVLATRSFKFL